MDYYLYIGDEMYPADSTRSRAESFRLAAAHAALTGQRVRVFRHARTATIGRMILEIPPNREETET